jgi:hypothetical protein
MDLLDRQRAGKVAEISGWDTDENFFVEKAVLHSHRDGNNKVDLRARLRVGSLVFVRVSDDASMDRTVPVTYQVSEIYGNRNARNGAREVRLIRLRPREAGTRTLFEFTFRETAVN